jgi:hypothetical protein
MFPLYDLDLTTQCFLQKHPSTSSLLKVLEIERANKGKKHLNFVFQKLKENCSRKREARMIMLKQSSRHECNCSFNIRVETKLLVSVDYN